MHKNKGYNFIQINILIIFLTASCLHAMYMVINFLTTKVLYCNWRGDYIVNTICKILLNINLLHKNNFSYLKYRHHSWCEFRWISTRNGDECWTAKVAIAHRVSKLLHATTCCGKLSLHVSNNYSTHCCWVVSNDTINCSSCCVFGCCSPPHFLHSQEAISIIF